MKIKFNKMIRILSNCRYILILIINIISTNTYVLTSKRRIIFLHSLGRNVRKCPPLDLDDKIIIIIKSAQNMKYIISY